jgi:membrane protease YdiL (CAAX protease family)
MSGRRLLLTLGLWAAFSGLIVLAVVVWGRLLAHGWAVHHRADLSAILVAGVYLALLAALLLAFGGPAGIRDRLGFRYTSLADVAAAVGLWFLALIGGALLTQALTPLLGQPRSNTVDVLGQSFDPLFVALIVPTICLLAPATEELLFRGALFGWLRRWLPAAAAIPVTAGLFAGAHLLPALFPILFVFGLAATWMRERTGSTFNSFVMHATQNTFAVVATYLLLSHGMGR